MKLSSNLHKILNQLALRNTLKYCVWYSSPLVIAKGRIWECHICGEKFIISKNSLEIDEHGYQHLKEKNLLPFL